MPPGGQGGGNSLNNLVTALQNAVQAANGIAQALKGVIPSTTTGQLSASTLVVPDFVRVTGISVVAAGATGGLYDAANVMSATGSNEVAVVIPQVGYMPVNMVFANGLVYIPGAGQKAAFFYTRT